MVSLFVSLLLSCHLEFRYFDHRIGISSYPALADLSWREWSELECLSLVFTFLLPLLHNHTTLPLPLLLQRHDGKAHHTTPTKHFNNTIPSQSSDTILRPPTLREHYFPTSERLLGALIVVTQSVSLDLHLLNSAITSEAAYFLSHRTMTSVMQTPNKQQGRGQRARAHSSRPRNQATASQNGLTDSSSPMPNRSERNRQSLPAQSEDGPASKQDPFSPLTPPRPTNTTRSSDTQPTDRSANLSASTRKPRRGRKKTLPSGNGTIDSSSSSNNRSPPSTHNSTTITPMKQTQLYAGPTFHASPAPSSLPIPRLFSKSFPSLDKAADIEAATEDSTEESSNSTADDSPTLRPREEAKQPREPSPLDVFFDADRREKAQRTRSGPVFPYTNENRVSSKSPGLDASSGHASQVPGASTPRAELEASDRPKLNDEMRAESSPSIMVNHTSNGQNNAKAKTQALKHLLLNPKEQRPTPISSVVSNGQDGSLFTTPTYSGNSFRRVSGLITPVSPHNNSSSPSRPQSLGYNSPRYNSSTYSSQSPLSSHLRREIADPASVELPEAPATPTPSKHYNAIKPTNFANGGFGNSYRLDTPLAKRSSTKFQPEDALKVTLRNDNPSTSLLEDELRKILKLDSLGTSSVQSC